MMKLLANNIALLSLQLGLEKGGRGGPKLLYQYCKIIENSRKLAD
jgi:hypothetical protein